MSKRIVFFGTTIFSAVSLKKIWEKGYPIMGVIAPPDKTYGRGFKKHKSIIKIISKSLGFPLLLPTNLKSYFFLESLKKWKADIQVVVSFRVLPKEVWSLTKMGTFNLHASLLPEYRGAAPIHWAIIHGENNTGLTTFLINDKVDMGKILLNKEVQIGKQETFGDLYDRLAYIGSNLVLETIEGVLLKKIKPFPQLSSNFQIAPKISTQDCRINWNSSVKVIFNKIRGLSPHPSAWTFLYSKKDKKRMKIYRGKTLITEKNEYSGRVIITSSEIKISAKDGYILVFEAKIEGKRKMQKKDLINGLRQKILVCC
ncbi:MAG TPA: methionyl-tRNA formyltransferase [Candidatus Angelobacter sp.]|jgi:methionyl-tRNA formyltransferase|nr:methionyl-tRNA formyltransferase [Candidatus Angelobacter sp.]